MLRRFTTKPAYLSGTDLPVAQSWAFSPHVANWSPDLAWLMPVTMFLQTTVSTGVDEMFTVSQVYKRFREYNGHLLRVYFGCFVDLHILLRVRPFNKFLTERLAPLRSFIYLASVIKYLLTPLTTKFHHHTGGMGAWEYTPSGAEMSIMPLGNISTAAK